MARSNRTIVRTPRRAKVWAREGSTDVGNSLLINQIDVFADLLANYKTDMDTNRPPAGVTVMRIVGTLQPGNSSAATTNFMVAFHWGIAWVANSIAQASVGDAQIPDPAELGMREAQWLQRGTIFYRTNNNTNLAASVTGRQLAQSGHELDITQMRKQPTPDHELVLIVRTTGDAAAAPVLWFDINTMLALP